jgi:nitrogen regulatory protein PII
VVVRPRAHADVCDGLRAQQGHVMLTQRRVHGGGRQAGGAGQLLVNSLVVI